MSVLPGHDRAHDRLLLRIGQALAVCDSGACSKLCRRRCAATSGTNGSALGLPREHIAICPVPLLRPLSRPGGQASKRGGTKLREASSAQTFSIFSRLRATTFYLAASPPT